MDRQTEMLKTKLREAHVDVSEKVIRRKLRLQGLRECKLCEEPTPKERLHHGMCEDCIGPVV